jgi:hypothetical protein
MQKTYNAVGVAMQQLLPIAKHLKSSIMAFRPKNRHA